MCGTVDTVLNEIDADAIVFVSSDEEGQNKYGKTADERTYIYIFQIFIK